jgi:hypothetical protein
LLKNIADVVSEEQNVIDEIAAELLKGGITDDKDKD